MPHSDAFSTAYVAMRFFLGHREHLTEGLEAPPDSARVLAQRLLDTSAEGRAQVLSEAITPVVRALDAMRLT